MSGNFLQRGEPAIVNKWLRTKMALKGGADLVLEIPLEESIQSANNFARAGIRLAKLCQIDYLAFGSENPTIGFRNKSKLLNEANNNFQIYNNSFATQLFKNHSVDNPNDILGVNYAFWSEKIFPNLKLFPIKRKDSGYHDIKITGSIASATAIRNALINNFDKSSWYDSIPYFASKILEDVKLVDWNDFFPLLKYKIISTTPEELRNILGISEGIEYRILDKIKTSDNFNNFILKLKTKRYTYTHLQRLAAAILLSIPKNVDLNHKPRILGFNNNGKKFLNKLNTKNELMSRISKTDYQKDYYYSNRGDSIYRLINDNYFENKLINM